ncbi:matrixin [Halobium salinum]|uniref:Matrixin n=1 Tax=Halobium salinum TaxID=1364940 RepID=A0ABD5PI57_9EURY|nr:matrixin [Halobium salinum]
MNRLGVPLLVVLVVLAGCGGAGGGALPEGDDGADDATTAQATSADVTTDRRATAEPAAESTVETATGGPGADSGTDASSTEMTAGTSGPTSETASAGTGTPAGSASVDADNPWGRQVLTVGVVDATSTDRDYVALVRTAVEFWNTNGQAYGAYDARYQLDPDATDPDIEVRFVDQVESCGRDEGENLLGCAPRLDADSRAPQPVTLRIEAGYDDETTVEAVKHELGHVRGLTHDDEPVFMRASRVAYTLPQPDAVDRDYPWKTSAFTVYVDDSNVSAADRETFRRQVGHALAYYEDGPAGFPSNVSFTLVDDPEQADVVVRYVDDGGEAASRSSTVGTDPDGDGAIEYRTGATIELRNLGVDRAGYHTGYWLGRLLGADRDSELPEPFRTDADPTSEWWT